MRKTALGLIGCGAAAERYYLPLLKRHLRRFSEIFLVDRNVRQAQKIRDQLGHGRILDDFKRIVGKVEAVIICVPHFLHHSIAMDFLRSGCHVLCEKPMAETARQAREMVQEAQKNRISLAVNNTRRMFHSFRKVHEILASRELGDIFSIRYFEGMSFGWPSVTDFYVNPKTSDKGVLLDVGSHILDLICWWTGGKPDLISYQDDSFGGPESVAQVRARIDRCTIHVKISRLFDLPSRYIVDAALGSLSGHVYHWDRVTLRYRSGKTRNIRLKSKEKSYSDFVKPIFLNFLDVVTKGSRPLIPGFEVISSIAWIEECYHNRSRFPLPWYENTEAILV